jgi:hypothetical protein
MLMFLATHTNDSTTWRLDTNPPTYVSRRDAASFAQVQQLQALDNVLAQKNLWSERGGRRWIAGYHKYFTY